jgi:SAM-dependent methyltransferase
METNRDAENLQSTLFDNISAQYSAHYGDAWSQRYRRQFMNDPMLGNVQLSGANTIEAMSGAGETTAYLLEKGAQVTGIDISQEQMDLFHSRFPMCETRCISMLSTGLASNAYDCVVVLGGLHHLHPHVDEAIHEIYRILKPGGYFCFVEPHKGAFPDWIRQLWYKSDHLFAANEAAIDVDALKAQWSSKFKVLKEEYKGNIAYLFVYNSLIFRIPLKLKRLYSPVLLKMESLIERVVHGRFLTCFVVCQWRKT